MSLSDRENYLSAIEFRNPEWIPCFIGLSPLAWHVGREELEDLVLRHPLIFRDYTKGSMDFDNFPAGYRAGELFRDNWGCVWQNAINGLEGVVVKHPLEDWGALESYQPPDLLTKAEREDRDWEQIRRDIAEQKKRGELIVGTGERLFDRMYFLRGFENLMMDIATDDPHLPKMIEMLLDYELRLVEVWLDVGVDMIAFHTDIGTQDALMISPAKFRRYIKPMFAQIFRRCRDAGVHVLLSSDGCLLEIVDDLVECGVSVHDPQVRANTVEGIELAYKGKMCINLDLDRQMFPFCTPQAIDDQVREGVDRLNLPQGGLMMQAGIYGDDVPLKNIEALCNAMEKYCLRRP